MGLPTQEQVSHIKSNCENATIVHAYIWLERSSYHIIHIMEEKLDILMSWLQKEKEEKKVCIELIPFPSEASKQFLTSFVTP